jgi:hypothetical protein
MPTLAALHEEANAAIRRLDEALAEQFDELAASTERHHAIQIQLLPEADYGSVDGCDAAMRELENRIDTIEQLPDDTVELAVTRREAIDALRRLWTEINAQRSRLAMA